MATELYFLRDVAPCFAEAGIPVRRTTLTGSEGLLFPARYRAAFQAALGWPPEETKTVPTSEWSVEELIRTRSPGSGVAPPPVSLRTQGCPSPAWTEYLDDVWQWCETHPQPFPVVIHFTSEKHVLSEHGSLHLCFGGRAEFAVRVWAHQRDVFYQCAHFWVGELGPEHAHCRALIPPLLGEFIPRILGRVREDPQQGEAFITALADRADAEQEAIDAEIPKQQRLVERLQKQLVEALRALSTLETRREHWQQSRENRQDHLRQQLASLAGREYVRSLHVHTDRIVVVTDRILIEQAATAREPAALYDIGAFRIDMFTDGREGCARLTNLSQRGPSPTGSREGFHHPHVLPDGVPCLGTINASLPRLIARHEYTAACDLLVNFLRTANPADTYGRHITKWPRFS